MKLSIFAAMTFMFSFAAWVYPQTGPLVETQTDWSGGPGQPRI